MCKRLTPLLLIILVFSSCKTARIADSNYFNRSELYNDSISLKATFFGDIVFQPIKKSEFKHKIKPLRKKLKYNDLLVYGKTNMSPFYDVMLFYRTGDFLDSIKHKNSVNHTIHLQKLKDNKTIDLYLIGKDEMPPMSDAEKIITSVKFDSDFNNELTYFSIFDHYKNEDNILFIHDKMLQAPIKEKNNNKWIKFQLLATLYAKAPNSTYYYKTLINKPLITI